MLTFKEWGTGRTLVVMLHWLGGSARTWTEVSERLAAQGVRCAAIDLPGFGESRETREFSVEAMVRGVVETIRSLRVGGESEPWVLVGHSMGGKLAGLIARSAEEGEAGLANLRGVVLVSPSPPSPEPMKENKRKDAIRDLGPKTSNPAERWNHAEDFVDANTGKLPMLDAIRARAVDDVAMANPDAFVAWMTTGSKVDCCAAVGVLSVPALILAGTEEEALGPGVQAQLTLPHFVSAKVVPLEGSGHLSPLERPGELSDRMAEFFGELGVATSAGPELGPEMLAVIESERTSPRTREVLLRRMESSDAPGVLYAEQLRTLRAVADRVVPGSGLDLAKRADQMLAQSKHDGWRFGALPEDAAAWRVGLHSLNHASTREFSVPFVALDATRQDELLHRAQSGSLGKGLGIGLGKGLLDALNVFERGDLFSGEQMRAWFEDVRGEFAKLYVADPRTMERIGFRGFADEVGFTKIQLGQQNEDEI